MRNRINVMLSRAQWGLYILGNKATLEANADRAPMWNEVSAPMGRVLVDGVCVLIDVPRGRFRVYACFADAF